MRIYEYVGTSDPYDYVSIESIFEAFQGSEEYKSLKYTEKRNYNKTKLIELLSTSKIYGKNYKDRYEKQINGNRIRPRNVLLGYKRIVDTEGEDNENPLYNVL